MIKFDEKQKIDSVNGALALRSNINKIVDEICERGYTNICWLGIGGTWASGMQATVHMKELSAIETWAENAAEFLTTGNKRITKDSVIVLSSVTGNTQEIVDAVKMCKQIGATIIAFLDSGKAALLDMVDYGIVYPVNEQLKFFMVADRFMYNNHEFDDYEEMYKEFEQYLAVALVEVEKKCDAFAMAFAKKHCEDEMHYFVGAGNQWGATYSYAMCTWEEQLWIKTKSISAPEFFHGMFEIVTKHTPVTVYIGEDKQRVLSERVAKFLPRICENYTIIDTKEYELKGISEKYRSHISHLVLRAIENRLDVHMEVETRHPMDIRRYYRRLDY